LVAKGAILRKGFVGFVFELILLGLISSSSQKIKTKFW
jgi:hypothetical protein